MVNFSDLYGGIILGFCSIFQYFHAFSPFIRGLSCSNCIYFKLNVKWVQIKSYGISFIHLFSLNLAKIGHFHAFFDNSPENGEYLGISKTHFLKTGTRFLTLKIFPLPLKFGTFLHKYKTYTVMEAFFSKVHIFDFIFFRIFFSRHFFAKKIQNGQKRS